MVTIWLVTVGLSVIALALCGFVALGQRAASSQVQSQPFAQISAINSLVWRSPTALSFLGCAPMRVIVMASS